MKILLINNFHYHRGGTERAYFDVAKILEENGHEVAFFSSNHFKTIPSRWEKYFVKYHELGEGARHGFFGKIRIVLRIWYNFEARRKLRELLKEFNPDVAHLHNVFHHLSFSVINELKSQNIPTVMTLHDFQFVCPNNILFSNGKIWEDSKNGKLYRCVSEKCVHNSYLKSLVCVIENCLHRALKTIDKVDVLTAPSNFLSEKAKEFGFEGEIIKLPNPVFIEDDSKIGDSLFGDEISEEYILYLGRLSEEKGVDVLIQAFSKLKTKQRLVVMGDGPLKKNLMDLVKKLKIAGRVDFLGYDKSKHTELQKHAEVIVSPSMCYENAPYGVLDAMSLKKPVICANLGGSKEIIEDGRNGMLFEAGNRDQLARKIEFALDNKEEMERMAQRGYLDVIRNNSSEVFLNRVMAIYQQAISKKKSSKNGKKES
ncbi:MAG: glycosyltransferase [Patescibacteria group bacterium]|nr:glycosyltransferase [Patescibacteria group bacterium]